MGFKFAGQMAVLDNHICRFKTGTSKDGSDQRHKVRTRDEIQVWHLLLQCPTNVLTEDSVAWFCSAEWDCLKGRDVAGRTAAGRVSSTIHRDGRLGLSPTLGRSATSCFPKASRGCTSRVSPPSSHERSPYTALGLRRTFETTRCYHQQLCRRKGVYWWHIDTGTQCRMWSSCGGYTKSRAKICQRSPGQEHHHKGAHLDRIWQKTTLPHSPIRCFQNVTRTRARATSVDGSGDRVPWRHSQALENTRWITNHIQRLLARH